MAGKWGPDIWLDCSECHALPEPIVVVVNIAYGVDPRYTALAFTPAASRQFSRALPFEACHHDTALRCQRIIEGFIGFENIDYRSTLANAIGLDRSLTE